MLNFNHYIIRQSTILRSTLIINRQISNKSIINFNTVPPLRIFLKNQKRFHSLILLSSKRFISFSFIPKVLIKSVRFPAYLGTGAAAFGSYMAYKVNEVNDYTIQKWNSLKDYATYLKDNFNDSELFNFLNKNDKDNNDDEEDHNNKDLITPALIASTLYETTENNENEEDDDDDEDFDSTHDEIMNLTKQMIEIRSILNKINSTSSQQLTLPSIVVIGSQSSGKSSVLESIVGKEFLPKGSNMVTRKPIELTLVNTPTLNETTADFPALRKYNIKNFNEVSKLLFDLNMSVPLSEAISEEPIQLTIKSPNVPDLSLVDLPGYIQVEAADQPIELKSKIAKLCDRYLQDPNIILAVSAADVDLANSSALRASKIADPKGLRTIGVITKLDLVDPTTARNILNNKKYPLTMGYVGVITKSITKGLSATNNLLNIKSFGSSSTTKDDRSQIESERQTQTKKFENDYFKENKNLFKDCEVSTKKLRKKLINVLERSMSNALEPTSNLIQKELDDTSYLFKVKYNDRQLTPKSYLLNNIDILKLAIKEFQEKFHRKEMKSILDANLDQEVLDFLASKYWKDNKIYNSSYSNNNDSEMLYWHKKLELASSSLTKIGVGRLSTILITKSILKELENILSSTQLKNHELIKELVTNTAFDVLNSKYYTTADQVENCIKPLKYEVDLEDRDWDFAHERANKLVKEELRQCNERFDKIKNTIGNKKLNQVMKYISEKRKANNGLRLGQYEETLGMSKILLERGSEALFLKERSSVLQFRLKLLKNKCNTISDKYQCPEIFLNAVSDKLTSTAVLFLNVELLSDFFYNFPIELDKKLNVLTDDQIEIFAKQDTKIAKHIELQQRKELLELALEKINSILIYKKSYKSVKN